MSAFHPLQPFLLPAFTFLAEPPCYGIATGDTMASSAPSPEEIDPYADRRAYPRAPVALPAFLQANGEHRIVQVLDLSAGGAKLNCPISLSVGTAVALDCGTFGRTAVVRWQTGELLGLSCDKELDARELGALIDRSRALQARMKTRE